MTDAARIVVLVAVWVLAWGDASPANLVTGALLAALLLAAFPSGRNATRFRIHPVGAARLVAYVVGQLVTSNYLVAREILSRRNRVQTGVLVYRMRDPSDAVITLMANVIALTPGTMTVEATREPGELHVHFLLLEDVDAARRSLARLERLVTGAIAGDPRDALAREHEQ